MLENKRLYIFEMSKIPKISEKSSKKRIALNKAAG